MKNLTLDEFKQVYKMMGFELSPYLAIEGYTISKGGAPTHGKGLFDLDLSYAWYQRRLNTI